MSRPLMILSVVLWFSAAGAFAQTAADPEAADPADANAAADAQEARQEAQANQPVPLHEHPTIVKMWEENNRLRAQYGLPPQRLSPELCRAAQDHANYMARTGDYNHHGNGGIYNRVVRNGYRGAVGGEIIHSGPRTIQAAFQGWLFSPPHRAILLGGATECGFGYGVTSGGGTYWVGNYGHARGE